MPRSIHTMTPGEIRDSLETLTGDDRLDISAIKGAVSHETLAFNKDTVTQVIKTLTAGAKIKCVTVNVTTAFVGNKTITIGFPANPSEITGNSVNLTKTNLYKFDSYRKSVAPETLMVYFSGMATAGAGEIVVEFVNN